MANYTKQELNKRELRRLIAEMSRPKPPNPFTAYCACGAIARWEVYGALYCSQCLPVEHRVIFLSDATAADLEAWSS